MKQNMLKKKDIILSNSHYVAPIGHHNVMVVGGTGMGKTRFYVKPNILQMNASFVVMDPRKEILSSVGNTLKNNGYKIKVLNFTNPHKNTDSYNPLEYINDEYDVNTLVRCIIMNTATERYNEDSFITVCGKYLLNAIMLYIAFHCSDEEKNFFKVIHILNEIGEDFEGNYELFEKCPHDSLVYKYYTEFNKVSGFSKKETAISLKTRLGGLYNIYSDKLTDNAALFSSHMAKLMSKNTLEFENMGIEKTALFIVPSIIDNMSHWQNILISMLYTQIININKDCPGKHYIPIHLIMDEFSNYGVIPNFAYELITLNQNNMSVSILLQDTYQLLNLYKDEWKEIMFQCDFKIFFGGSSSETLDYFSSLEKQKTKHSLLNFNKNREKVVLNRLTKLPPNKCVVYYPFSLRKKRMFIDKKYRYETHPNYNQTGDYHIKEICNY